MSGAAHTGGGTGGAAHAAAAVTAQGVDAWMRAFSAAVAEQREYLTELDAAIGDADHGVNMDRGLQAVLARLGASRPSDAGAESIGALLKTIGMTLVASVGGAAGPLYGTLFLEMGKAADREAAGQGSAGGGSVDGGSGLTIAQWAAVLEAGVAGVQSRGKAQLEDKTMVDALVPAAEQGMKATVPLVARKGRASYLGERSAGHQDPGATSAWLLCRAAAEALV